MGKDSSLSPVVQPGSPEQGLSPNQQSPNGYTCCLKCGFSSSNCIRCSVCWAPYCALLCQKSHWHLHMVNCRPMPRAIFPKVQQDYRVQPFSSFSRRPPPPRPISLSTLGSLSLDGSSNGTFTPKPSDWYKFSSLETYLDIFKRDDTFELRVFNDGCGTILEEFTIARVMRKMVEDFEKDTSKLPLDKINIGDLTVVHDGTYKRAFVTQVQGSQVDVIFIDTAQRFKAQKERVYAPKQFYKKYMSLGIFLELPSGLPVSNDVLLTAKILEKTEQEKRTIGAKVEVYKNQLSLGTIQIHPWYKLDPTSHALLLPDCQFAKLKEGSADVRREIAKNENGNTNDQFGRTPVKTFDKHVTPIKTFDKHVTPIKTFDKHVTPTKASSDIPHLSNFLKTQTLTNTVVEKPSKITLLPSPASIKIPNTNEEPRLTNKPVVQKPTKVQQTASNKPPLPESVAEPTKFQQTASNNRPLPGPLVESAKPQQIASNNRPLPGSVAESAKAQQTASNNRPLPGPVAESVKPQQIASNNRPLPGPVAESAKAQQTASNNRPLPELVAEPTKGQQTALSNQPLPRSVLEPHKTDSTRSSSGVENIRKRLLANLMEKAALPDSSVEAPKTPNQPKIPKVADFPPNELTVNDKVAILEFDPSVDKIILQKITQLEDCDNITTQLSTSELKVIDNVPEIDEVYACKWTNAEGDGLFYRAKINRINNNLKKVKVTFVDYCNDSTEPFENLAHLPVELTTDKYPFMAITAKLAGLPSDLYTDATQDLAEAADFKSQPWIVSKMDQSNGETVFTLFDINGLSLNDRILKEVLGVEPESTGLFYNPKAAAEVWNQWIGKSIEVKPIFIESPIRFGLLRTEDLALFSQIARSIDLAGKDQGKNFSPKVGNLYLAKSTSLGAWCRCVVNGRDGNDVTLDFPDYIMQETLTLNDLAPISLECAKIPFQGIGCILEDFVGLDCDVSEEFISLLADISTITVTPIKIAECGTVAIVALDNLTEQHKAILQKIKSSCLKQN